MTYTNESVVLVNNHLFIDISAVVRLLTHLVQLQIQTEFAYLSNHKAELEEKMDDEELRQKREIIQLEKEKVNIRNIIFRQIMTGEGHNKFTDDNCKIKASNFLTIASVTAAHRPVVWLCSKKSKLNYMN